MTKPLPNPLSGSPFARWDGRWKTAGLFFLGLSASIVTSLAGVCAAGVIALFFAVLGRLPIRSAFGVAGFTLMGILPLAVAMPFLSSSGGIESLSLVLRALAVGLIGHMAFGTSPPHRTFAALAALKVPRPLILLLQFSYRYAMLLAGEVRRVRISMATRGFRLRPTFHSTTSMSHLIGSVLVRGGDRADSILRAMQARGFQGTMKTLESFQTRRADLFGFFGALFAAIAIQLVDRFAG